MDIPAGTGVGVTSSVIPYVCDQLAMARLPRATLAMLLALLPATACVAGAAVLHQLPGRAETIGVAWSPPVSPSTARRGDQAYPIHATTVR